MPLELMDKWLVESMGNPRIWMPMTLRPFDWMAGIMRCYHCNAEIECPCPRTLQSGDIWLLPEGWTIRYYNLGFELNMWFACPNCQDCGSLAPSDLVKVKNVL